MWSILAGKMATMGVVSNLEIDRHYGKRACLHCPFLCSMGKLLSHKRILFQCDNQSVVAAIQKGSSKMVSVMHFLQFLWFFVAYYDIDITSTHIAGIANTTADHLSKNNLFHHFSH